MLKYLTFFKVVLKGADGKTLVKMP